MHWDRHATLEAEIPEAQGCPSKLQAPLFSSFLNIKDFFCALGQWAGWHGQHKTQQVPGFIVTSHPLGRRASATPISSDGGRRGLGSANHPFGQALQVADRLIAFFWFLPPLPFSQVSRVDCLCLASMPPFVSFYTVLSGWSLICGKGTPPRVQPTGGIPYAAYGSIWYLGTEISSMIPKGNWAFLLPWPVQSVFPIVKHSHSSPDSPSGRRTSTWIRSRVVSVPGPARTLDRPSTKR